MDKQKLIEKFNQAVSLELGALLQYNQYSHVLTGPERHVWHEWFEETAKEAYSHARIFAAKVVALGGVPSVEPAPVKQTNDLVQMLENSLEVERRAVQIYTEARHLAEGNFAYCNLLEDQIQDEQDDVEEIEKFLNKVKPAAAKQTVKQVG
ncbi:MAG: ferritin-like domain-containing protein [Planctomycetia bacterium]|nr:ferritin-like domain-containing protein [Planctomycetia bacterium]